MSMPPAGLPPPLIAELSPWGPTSCDAKAVGALRGAISERRVVAFRYVDTEGTETEEEPSLSPW